MVGPIQKSVWNQCKQVSGEAGIELLENKRAATNYLKIYVCPMWIFFFLLSFKLMPDKTFVVKGEKCTEGKLRKDRVMMLVRRNAVIKNKAISNHEISAT